MTSVEVNGTKLAYTERGSGEPVVFVHGGVNDMRSWRDQMEPFGSRFRAVALSCRHFHPNEPVADDAVLRLDTLADDLAAFLRVLRLSRAHLVGSSSGAFVCLLLARREPDLVRSLVLAEPPVLPMLGVSAPPRPLELLRLLIRKPATALTVMKFGATGIGPATRAFERGEDREGARIFVRAVLGREAAANLAESTRRQVHDNATTFKAQLRGGLPPFDQSDACRIDKPTLLVTGEHSAPFHHRIVDELERALPRVERLDIQHASHLMHEDRPEEFSGAVLEFFARNQAVEAGEWA